MIHTQIALVEIHTAVRLHALYHDQVVSSVERRLDLKAHVWRAENLILSFIQREVPHITADGLRQRESQERARPTLPNELLHRRELCGSR